MINTKLYMLLSCVLYFVLIIVTLQHKQPALYGTKKVGLCVVATGPYIRYVHHLLDSADRYFLPHHNVTYFVFTDRSFEHRNAVTVYQERLGWPYDSLKRFHIYDNHQELFHDLDYLYAIDADMCFEALVGDEILSDRVGTISSVHLFSSQKPYEYNPISTAYVHVGEGTNYYAGAFYGGTTKEFLQLLATVTTAIDIDLQRRYIAWANDESYLNRYFIDFPPTVSLSPSYCHFDHWRSPFEKKIVAYDDKDYSSMRKAANKGDSLII